MLAGCPDRDVQAFALEMVRYLYRYGNQESCRELAERLIKEWTRQSGPDYDRVLDAERRLADALRELGQYSDCLRRDQDHPGALRGDPRPE